MQRLTGTIQAVGKTDAEDGPSSLVPLRRASAFLRAGAGKSKIELGGDGGAGTTPPSSSAALKDWSSVRSKLLDGVAVDESAKKQTFLRRKSVQVVGSDPAAGLPKSWDNVVLGWGNRVFVFTM